MPSSPSCSSCASFDDTVTVTIRAPQAASRAATGIAIVALVMGLVAFLLGSAPFTPALFLAMVAVPLSVVAFVFRAKRLAAVAFYWAAAALITNPIVRIAQADVDIVLLILGVTGAALSIVCYGNHMRSRGAARQ